MPAVGAQLRERRRRRHTSQIDLAVHADVSTRHLSFVETGRSLPSREMVLRLADRLEVPLRERNRLLTAAGCAPPEPIHVDAGVYVPLHLASPLGVLSFVSTITVFGTPTDVTLSELALESFFPADESTSAALRMLAASDP